MAHIQREFVRCKKCGWEQQLWTWKSNPIRRIWELFIWCVYPRKLYEDDVTILRACRVYDGTKLVHSYRYFFYQLKREIVGICNQVFSTSGSYSRNFNKAYRENLRGVPCPDPSCEGTLEYYVKVGE